MESSRPTFSIIILCWNSNRTIGRCLDALSAQTDKDFEILLVDNGSPEPISPEFLAQYDHLPIKFIQLKQNIGFAAGNNLAVDQAQADYLVLLNADAFPRPDWLEQVTIGINKYPNNFYATKLVMAEHPERYDGMGDVYHVSGLVWRRGYNTHISPLKDFERDVFSACGAAAVYPTAAYREAGGLDEDYVAYVEDVDLGFRLRLMGYRCIYLPEAVVDHLGSGSTSLRSDLSVYYGQRNLVSTFIKNMPGPLVWILAPGHILANLLMILLGITRKQGMVTLRAKWDAMNNLGAILKKRGVVQRRRIVPIFRIMRLMDWNPISPFLKLLGR